MVLVVTAARGQGLVLVVVLVLAVLAVAVVRWEGRRWPSRRMWMG